MLANTRDKDLALFVDLARERGQTVSGETVDCASWSRPS
jgi:hypothetical protein